MYRIVSYLWHEERYALSLFYKYPVPLALMLIRLALPQRGKIFIEKEISERNRPLESHFQGKTLFSDVTAFACTNVVI